LNLPNERYIGRGRGRRDDRVVEGDSSLLERSPRRDDLRLRRSERGVGGIDMHQRTEIGAEP
jgi:hypothetical protein